MLLCHNHLIVSSVISVEKKQQHSFPKHTSQFVCHVWAACRPDGWSWSFDEYVHILSSVALLCLVCLVPRCELSQSLLFPERSISGSQFKVEQPCWTAKPVQSLNKFNTCKVQLFPGCYYWFCAICVAVNLCYTACMIL